MNFKRLSTALLTATTFFLVLGNTAFVWAQQQEMELREKREAAIETFQARLAEIEKELTTAETKRSQALGEEAFQLIGKIDQTYVQLKDMYQRQVIQLNKQVQQTWRQLEIVEGETPGSLEKKLDSLESDWEQAYQRLTQNHERHLKQMGESIAKLRSELSAIGSDAQAELATSHFEAVARWEEAHEIFLSMNEAYVDMVDEQLSRLRKKKLADASNSQLEQNLERVRGRYLAAHTRLRDRLKSHLTHLDDEYDVRKSPLTMATEESKKLIREKLHQLSQRKHKTYEKLQTSYSRTIESLEEAGSWTNADLHNKQGLEKTASEDQLAEWKAESIAASESLKTCCNAQKSYIKNQLEEIARCLAEVSSAEKRKLENHAKELEQTTLNLDKQLAVIQAKLNAAFRH